MGEVLVMLCFGCWVIPMVALGILYGVTRSITNAVQTRGANGDGLYCCRCRFDLRGNTTWECAECGERVDRPISPGYPRGGVLIKDLHPPMNRAIAVMLYIVAGFVPAVIGLLLLGLMMPINYQREVSVDLSPVDYAPNVDVPDIYFQIETERSWLGHGGFESVRIHHYEYYYEDSETLSIDPDKLENQTQNAWDFFAEDLAWLPSNNDEQRYRDEFFELVKLIATDQLDEAEQQATLYQVGNYDYTYPSFHPLYTLVIVLGLIAALIGLGWWAVRDCQNREQAYREKIQGIHKRMEQVIEQNCERVGAAAPSG